MRLVDTLLRGGHLSDQSLVDAWQTGDRPVHLDRCELCLDRTVELSRFLAETRRVAIDEADAAFPPERLAAQQSQILRRLEHLERPARLITFPNGARAAMPEHPAGQHWRGWIVAAAAAGLLIGIVSDRVAVGVTEHAAAQAASARQAADKAGIQDAAVRPLPPDDLMQDPFDTQPVKVLKALDDGTPRAREAALSKVR